VICDERAGRRGFSESESTGETGDVGSGEKAESFEAERKGVDAVVEARSGEVISSRGEEAGE